MNFSDTPITFILIAANVLFSIIGFSNDQFISKTIMWPYGVKREKQFGRFITSGFIHADTTHLFFNMLTFFFFGQNVEMAFKVYGLGGPLAFLLLYFIGLIVSDLPSYFKHKDDPSYRSLGASGAVSAIVFAGVLFNPWARLRIMGAIPVSYFLFAILYIVYCIYMSKKSSDNVNHDAHLYGSLFGLAFTIACIYAMNPSLMEPIIEQFKNPSILGR